MTQPNLNGEVPDSEDVNSRDYSFDDYVNAGLEINVIVAIDFTRSNGDPLHMTSLHGFTGKGFPSSSNQYVKVIESMIGILQQYDSNRRFPLFGFGAKLPPSQTLVSDCFALNGDFFHPEVMGLDGIIEAYRNAIGTITFHGPTRFAELLKETKRWAEPLIGFPKFLILLILTDGVIEDLQATIDEIVDLSTLPVSVLIAGIGDEDFSMMDILDADKTPLKSSRTGETMSRDIVQFIAYRDFMYKPIKELTDAAMEEIRREVVNYFGQCKIYPRREGRGFIGELREEEEDDGTEDRLTPKHLEDRRNDLIFTIGYQGYDEGIAERVVRQCGVLSPDPFHVIDVMFHLHKNRDKINPFPNISSTGQIAIAERMGVSDRINEEVKRVVEKEREEQEALVMKKHRHRDTESLGRCRVCYLNPINVMIKACNHKIVCRDCFERLQDKICPLCREIISGYEIFVNSF